MSDNAKPNFWDMDSKLDANSLLNALSHEDKMVRRQAAASLQAIKAVAAIDVLRQAHKVEEDPETGLVIASAIQVLSRLVDGGITDADNDSEAPRVKRLIAQLSSDNPEVIAKAAQQLGDMGDKIAVEGLIIAFNNQKLSIHVRLAIAEALLKLESAPVEVALLANVRHTDWHIRRNGAAILGQLQAEWAIEPLARALNDPHPVVRRTALAALKHIGTPESRKALAQHAPSSSARSLSTTAKTMPKKVSGIEIKRPSKGEDTDSASSSLLERLEEKRAQEAQSKKTTEALDQTIVSKRSFEPTQPINDNMLDDLDALLDSDEFDD
ncbi:MAG: HEAT repeat domain-containing protein [Chloroflexota bacterium]